MNLRIVYTLVFVKNDSKILLGFKKRGLGVQKWNGFGGKVEKGESLLDGAIRELKEESNITSSKLKHIGVLVYEVLHQKKIDLVHVFTANEFTGTPAESEEMKPKWFDIENIPYDKMWADAKLWHPQMLKDKYFVAHVVYKNDNEFIRPDVREYDSLPSVIKAIDNINYFSN